jgi:hypothetical protein
MELKPLPIIRGKPLAHLKPHKNYIIREIKPNKNYYQDKDPQINIMWYETPYYYETKREYIGIKYLGVEKWKDCKAMIAREYPYFIAEDKDIIVKFQSIQRLKGDVEPLLQQEYFNATYTRFFEVNNSQDIGDYVNVNMPVAIQVAQPDDGLRLFDLADARRAGGKRTKNRKKTKSKYKNSKRYKK